MDRRIATVLYLMVMIGAIIAVDVLFLSGSTDTTLRLFVNIGMVAVFLGGYLLLFRRRR